MAGEGQTQEEGTMRHVLLANGNYGLYIGQVESTDAEIIEKKAARVIGARHVARWFGKTGGITSLAAFGPCGKNAQESRVGAPCNGLLTGIVNVFDLTPEAVAVFEAIRPTDG